MKVILNEDVRNLGEEGDVVQVKRGYARNFLLPNNMAVVYNNANRAIFASRADAIEKRKEAKRLTAASLKERLDDITIKVLVSAGESGRLFGSVTSTMVQEELAKLGIDVERKRIEIASHAIKMVGTYSVRIRLYEQESSTIKLIVTSEAIEKREEAERIAAEKAAVKAAEKAAESAEVKAVPDKEAPAKAVVEVAESVEVVEEEVESSEPGQEREADA